MIRARVTTHVLMPFVVMLTMCIAEVAWAASTSQDGAATTQKANATTQKVNATTQKANATARKAEAQNVEVPTERSSRLNGADRVGSSVGELSESVVFGSGSGLRRSGRISNSRVELVISVVGDIAPDWAEKLRSQRAENPALFGESIRPHMRRLMGLGMLRERNPELYTLRVAELALKRGLRDKAAEYHRMLADDPESSSLPAIELAIRDLAKESVDLELRARAMELAALAEAVKEMKNLLLEEATAREARIESLIDTLLDEPADGPSFDEALESMPPMPPRPGRRGSTPSSPQVDSTE